MKRHNGIDALRIVSMFMVVILHTLGHGGILSNTTPLSGQYCLSWFLEITCYCAVNCFALISGFVMYRSKPSISRLLQLWLQVAFYTLLITGVSFLFVPESRNLDSLISAFFPVSAKAYWYISAYFGFYLLSPLLNTALQNSNPKQLALPLLGLFILFSLMPTSLLADPLHLNAGYSTLWLYILYIVGACIHKYDIPAKIKTGWTFLLFLLAVLITLISKIALNYIGFEQYDDILISYTSPTIIVSGIALFIIFAKLDEIRPLQKVINFLAPASLGVYLIHVHPIIWQYLIADFSLSFLNYNPIVMVLMVLGASCGIYLLCSAIELGRIKLFALLRIKDLCSKIDHFILKKLHSSDVVHRK